MDKPKEKQIDIFTISPNPSSDIININYPIEKIISIEILDLTGRVFKKYAPLEKINISDMNSGVHIVVIHLFDGSTKIERFIKL